MYRITRLLFHSLIFLFLSHFAQAVFAGDAISIVEPTQAGLSSKRLDHIEPVIKDALSQELMPGCVILIGRKQGIVYRHAFGKRQVEPAPEEMTLDTLFDLASLTKPVSTATGIMLLLDQGKIDLDDPIAKYLPEFATNEKAKLTIRDLLVHQSGLTPDNPITHYLQGKEASIRNIMNLSLQVPHRSRFQYSDVNFIVLGKLVEKVSGMSQDKFSKEQLWKPLAMNETGYLPDEALHKRAATTEKRGEKWLKGAVHDPRAELLGGVAGHAGLFSTADDLAKYATMILQGGELFGKRLMKKSTLDIMLTPQQVPGDTQEGLAGIITVLIHPIEVTCSPTKPWGMEALQGLPCG